jgi:hypothetical protein
LSDHFRVFEVPSPIYSRVNPCKRRLGWRQEGAAMPTRGSKWLRTTNINSEQIEKARDTMESGLNSTVQTFRRAADQFTQVLGLAGPQAEELVKKSSQNVEALSQASNILVKGAQEFSSEWFELVRDHMSKNIDAMNRLASCHSLQNFVSVQGDIARATG